MSKHKFRIQSSTNDEQLPSVIGSRIDNLTSTVDFEFTGIDSRIIPQTSGRIHPRHEYISFEFEGTQSQADTLQTEIETSLLYDSPWYVIYHSDTVDSDGNYTEWAEKTRYCDVPPTF